jgi:hypothetical protein
MDGRFYWLTVGLVDGADGGSDWLTRPTERTVDLADGVDGRSDWLTVLTVDLADGGDGNYLQNSSMSLYKQLVRC